MQPLRIFLVVAGLFACRQVTLEPGPIPTTTLAQDVPMSTPIIDLPDSRGGRVARELLGILERADDAEIRAFIERNTSPAMRALAPPDVTFPLWKRLAGQSGGFDIVAVEALEADGVQLELQARLVDRRVSLSLLPEAQEPFTEIHGRVSIAAHKSDPGKLPKVAMPEAEVAAAIARRAEQLAATDRFSGVVLVLKGERELVRSVQGHAEKSFAAPNRFDTKFNLGSMNKMFTAVAIAQLVEQGKLSFDDTVLAVLPDYPDPAFAGAAKIHHLLSHTSGIGGNIFAEEVYEHRDRFKDPADYLPLIAGAARDSQPGERFQYANAGFIVAALVIERLSGESYDDYLAKHVFAPAGMHDTASYAWDEVVPNLAVGYDCDPMDVLMTEPRRTNITMLPYRGSPAGGGYSTVPDLQAFAAALRGHRLLGAAMTETVTEPRIAFSGFGKYGYGFLSYAIEGRDVRGHSGGHLGINGVLQMFWDGSYTVIVLGNYGAGSAETLSAEITDLLAAQGPSPI